MHRHAARAGWLRERGDYAPGNLDNGGSPLGPCAMERSWSPDEDAGCSGAGISHGVRSMYSDFENPGNSGQLLVAIDINTLMPLDTFYDRMEFLIGAIRDCEGVLLPGETRWRARAETEAAGGIRLDEQSITAKVWTSPPPWQKV